MRAQDIDIDVAMAVAMALSTQSLAGCKMDALPTGVRVRIYILMPELGFAIQVENSPIPPPPPHRLRLYLFSLCVGDAVLLWLAGGSRDRLAVRVRVEDTDCATGDCVRLLDRDWL